jgi:glutathione S-transferase
MDPPKLYGTPLSHFTRKIRILLLELGVSFDFVRLPNLLDTSATPYGDNPLMRVPTFVDGAVTVIESDHIARYVVGAYDPSDRLGVRRDDVRGMNVLAVVNGVMANEVVLILAKRGGLTDVEGVTYFRKLIAAIDAGLAWLDKNTDPDQASFDYRDISLICMWQHVAHYTITQNLERRGHSRNRVRAVKGKVIRAAIMHHCVEDDEQLAGRGRQRHLRGLSGGDEAAVELTQMRVAAHGATVAM